MLVCVTDANLTECWETLDHGNGAQGRRGDYKAGGVPSRPA